MPCTAGAVSNKRKLDKKILLSLLFLVGNASKVIHGIKEEKKKGVFLWFGKNTKLIFINGKKKEKKKILKKRKEKKIWASYISSHTQKKEISLVVY